MTLEGKDFAVLAGIATTFLLGLWNLFENRKSSGRTRYIQTVTNQRIAWIEQLRQDIAAFISLANSVGLDCKLGGVSERHERIELSRLRQVIRLRLNPKGDWDKLIDIQLTEAYELAYKTDVSNEHDLLNKLDDLAVASRLLLKEEWEKVKFEAINGQLQ
jgi:hypothetical protein